MTHPLVKKAFVDAGLNTQDLPFQIYTIAPNRTWSLVFHNGMEIATVTGKRRLEALINHLKKSGKTSFQDLRGAAADWKKTNPRP